MTRGDDEVMRRLDELRDLFTRRLLDDRQKHATIDALQEELAAVRRGLAAEYLTPIAREIALVVDRLDRYAGPDPEFASSIGAELVDLLDRHGVTEVPAGGEFDPQRHEAVDTSADPGVPDGRVVGVRRRGFAHHAAVLRPVQVVVNVRGGDADASAEDGDG